MFVPELERLNQKQIKAFQEIELKKLLHYLNTNSKFYQEHFEKHQIDLSKIECLEDLTKIPVTTKDDLQNQNFDFVCVPKHQIIDYVTTSGTLGEPVVFAMTENDLERLAYNEFISFACASGDSNDLYQLMVTMDRRFMAGYIVCLCQWRFQ